MGFRFTEEQELLWSSAADFVDNEVIPSAAQIDEEGRFPGQLFRKVGELGSFGIRNPGKHGGSRGDNVLFALMYEELPSGSMRLAGSVAMQCLMGTDFVCRLGTEGQK